MDKETIIATICLVIITLVFTISMTILLTLSVTRSRYDVNEDGEVDIVDLAELQKYLVENK